VREKDAQQRDGGEAAAAERGAACAGQKVPAEMRAVDTARKTDIRQKSRCASFPTWITAHIQPQQPASTDPHASKPPVPPYYRPRRSRSADVVLVPPRMHEGQPIIAALFFLLCASSAAARVFAQVLLFICPTQRCRSGAVYIVRALVRGIEPRVIPLSSAGR